MKNEYETHHLTWWFISSWLKSQPFPVFKQVFWWEKQEPVNFTSFKRKGVKSQGCRVKTHNGKTSILNSKNYNTAGQKT